MNMLPAPHFPISDRAPNGALEFERLVREHDYRPHAIGVDGWVYGIRFDQRRIMRTGDVFRTVEEGPQFPAAFRFATRTSAGYVVFVGDHEDSGWLYFSPDFQGPYTMVQQVRRCTSARVFVGPGPTGESIVLVSEYAGGGTGIPRELWMSLDGGQTFTSIRSCPVNDENVNAHMHAACYDPVYGRIWCANGDGINSELSYSDDLGETWTVLETGGNSIYHQPTVLLPFQHRIVGARDSGSLGAGVNSLSPRTGAPREDYTIDPSIQASKQFGNCPQAFDREAGEAYVAFADSGSGTNKLWILATGDGGRTWHEVHERDTTTSSFTQGIVGPDKNDMLYLPGFDPSPGPPSSPVVDVARRLDWV